MTAQIRSEQAAALGGAAPCQPAKSPPSNPNQAGELTRSTSVLVIDREKKNWIGIELLDTKKRPVPNEAFVVTPPGRDPVKGTLDTLGRARVEGVDPGTCKIEFPRLHKKDFR